MAFMKGARVYLLGLRIEELGCRLHWGWMASMGIKIKDFVLR
jgi:hypothetical protein